jgi:hypothetical protein
MRNRDFLLGIMIYTLCLGLFLMIFFLPVFVEVGRWFVWGLSLAVLGCGILYGAHELDKVSKLLRKIDEKEKFERSENEPRPVSELLTKAKAAGPVIHNERCDQSRDLGTKFGPLGAVGERKWLI